jgi:hypothetical protein
VFKYFYLKVVAVAVAAEVAAIGAPNQVISPVIVLNQTHVVIPTNKVVMMNN